MCGIAGKCAAATRPVPPDQVRAALAPIRHRGPDGEGVWTGPGVGLGHLRLSILDLSQRAAQPMVSSDGRYVLSFNGEIYNFRELRQELAAREVAITSTGDTEVLLSYLAVHGCAGTFPRLDGDWAVAVWDTREEVLTLARDVHGVKPLYYGRTADGGLAFASEMKALVTTGLVAAEPDPAAVGAALLGHSVTWGDRTFYRGVHAVRPGEQLTFDRRRGTVDRRPFASLYEWVDAGLQQELATAPRAEVVRRVDEAVRAGVRSRLVSDAPLGCLASGGVDSSLIVANAVEDRADLPLYHADVAADSERPAAEALARTLGLQLRVVRVTDSDILAAVPDVTWCNDGPLTYHLNALPFFAVARLAGSDGIKVLLTGEGSDEYLLGYPEEALRPILTLANRVKAVPRSWLAALSPRGTRLFWPHPEDTYAHRLAELLSGFEQARLSAANRAAAPAGSARDRRSRDASLSLAQSHLVSLLHRNDRLGMAWGVEARFPFLAPEFARLAINLPDRYKLRRVLRPHDRRHPFVVDKWAVRAVAAQRLPAHLSGRPKRGFPVSIMQRLTVSPKFFADGFLADLYSLDEPAITMALGPKPTEWQTRLLLLEVWGQLFFRGGSPESVRESLHTHTQLAVRP
ncbi:MAG: asparagine synthase (glutamine-hydrolyzing) [Micromonosporaceae bacterium]|nr:asparagine synthase (glutamine-hydrolyzing) [Micromonosporaceae bacterium]